MRFAQIIAIILSTFVLAFPSFTLITIALLLAVVLFVVGIERIITGLFLQGKPRWTNIGLGVLVIVLSGISMECFQISCNNPVSVLSYFNSHMAILSSTFVAIVAFQASEKCSCPNLLNITYPKYIHG